MEESKGTGFFGSLFDTSFEDLITPRIIKVLYILAMIVIGITALVYVGIAFSADTGLGVATLFIFAPLGFLLYLIVTRVWLEVIIVLFKIKDATEKTAAN